MNCGVATVSPLDSATSEVSPTSMPIGESGRLTGSAFGISIWKQTYHLPHDRLMTAAPSFAPGGN